MSDVQDFYDGYVARQNAVGINQRHHSILSWLHRFGLRPTSRVLELGCGVGTLTALLADAVPEGALVGIDLSPKSIDAARQRLAGFDNVQLIAGDVLEVAVNDTYDLVVLPDVIEHIPLTLHSSLFGRVASWVRDDGFVLLHYPNPHYLAWCHLHKPEALQVIDQPVHVHELVGNTYPHGLYLDFFERYSIWVREGDYVVAVLRPFAGVAEFTDLPEARPGLTQRLLKKARRALGEG